MPRKNMKPEPTKKELIKQLTDEYNLLLNKAVDLDSQQIYVSRLIRINNMDLSKVREQLNEIRNNI
jgi:hypothetical protein